MLIKNTLPTIASIKPTGQNIAGLVTELIGEPGICTSLVTIRDTAYSPTELPGLSDSETPRASTSWNIATRCTATCRGTRKTESCYVYHLEKQTVSYFLTVFSRLTCEHQSEKVHPIL